MLTNTERSTAGECARRLLEAFTSGSQDRIREELLGAERLGAPENSGFRAETSGFQGIDEREVEFRELLGAIVRSVKSADPERFDSARRHVVFQMLVHVARSAN